MRSGPMCNGSYATAASPTLECGPAWVRVRARHSSVRARGVEWSGRARQLGQRVARAWRVERGSSTVHGSCARAAHTGVEAAAVVRDGLAQACARERGMGACTRGADSAGVFVWCVACLCDVWRTPCECVPCVPVAACRRHGAYVAQARRAWCVVGAWPGTVRGRSVAAEHGGGGVHKLVVFAMYYHST